MALWVDKVETVGIYSVKFKNNICLQSSIDHNVYLILLPSTLANELLIFKIRKHYYCNIDIIPHLKGFAIQLCGKWLL